jgi:hypothetical protein
MRRHGNRCVDWLRHRDLEKNISQGTTIGFLVELERRGEAIKGFGCSI